MHDILFKFLLHPKYGHEHFVLGIPVFFHWSYFQYCYKGGRSVLADVWKHYQLLQQETICSQLKEINNPVLLQLSSLKIQDHVNHNHSLMNQVKGNFYQVLVLKKYFSFFKPCFNPITKCYSWYTQRNLTNLENRSNRNPNSVFWCILNSPYSDTLNY